VRSKEEILKEIKTRALADPNIRAVILTSSRANPNAFVDLFSDYDIELIVSNRENFLVNDEWLSDFGEILHSYREDHDEFSMRLVLFRDYVRIDCKIYELAYFEKSIEQAGLLFHWDNGYTILVDKEGISSAVSAPSYTAFAISKPTENDFLSVVNEFWWDATYVAKSLWRNEIYFAKYMLDSVIRFSYLEKMIEWHIGIAHHWLVSTNKHGRFFKKYLDQENWEILQATFAGSNIEDNWNALFAMAKLFSRLAKQIAKELNYPYPQKTADDIIAYLEKISKLDTDAIDIE
jgi:aminoglycoside 6-adenylyltransferase